MSMNRFGIRLAAGLAVITLGSLAILQTRSDQDAGLEEPWPEPGSAAATEPPAPLGIEDDNWPAPPDDSATLVRGNNRTPEGDPLPEDDAAAAGPSSSFAMGNVQLASHAEPETAPADDSSPADDFGFPAPLEPQAAPDADSGDADSGDAGFGDASDQSSFEMPSNPPAMPGENTLRNEVTFGTSESQPVGSSLQVPSPRAASPANAASREVTEEEAAEEEAAEAAPAMSASWGTESLEPLSGDAEPPFPPSDRLESQEPEPLEVDSFGAGSDDSAAYGAGALAAGSFAPEMESAASAQPEQSPMATGGAEPLQALPENDAAAFAQDQRPRDRAAREPNSGSSSMGTASGSPAASQLSSANTTLQTIHPSEVLAQPGERRLEGAQAPSVVIHKRAPEEVRVGKPSEFVIQVKNVGTVAALDVRIFDSVPEGMELVATVPSATEVENMLSWELGDLEPGGERTVTMKLVPQSEGELGSVARVTFEAAASVRTVATRPELKLVQRAPEQVLIGQQLEIEVELSNTGSGTATGVMLQADLADGLDHPMGRQLDNLIGTMPPGDVRRQILRLRATKPGRVENTIRLTGEDGVATESSVVIETISPALEVALSGPSLRYLERQTTYNVQIGNSGTANAADVDVVAYLDRGLKFVSTEFEGQYDPNHHAVFWSLAELPVGQKGEVPLTLLPVEAGTQNVRLEAKAELGITASSEKALAIETLAELSFSIADDQDPIEIGSETTYEVRVKNSGSRDDTNVQLKVQLPPGMELVSADPQAGTDGRGLVVFQPIATLASKGEQKFRVHVRGTSDDTHVVQAMLSSDQSPKPVTKEESTTVYADR